MTKKERRDKIFWYLLIITTVIQAIFALIWLIYNHGEYHEEFLSNNYIKASKDLVVDDNMGIGYALFVRLFGFGRILYLAQAIVVAIATWYAFSASEHLIFDGVIAVEPKAWLVTAFVITNPLVLQSICTVLPNSLIFAGVLFIVGGVRRSNIKIILAGGIMLSLLNPDYLYVFAVSMIPVLVLFLVKKKKGLGIVLILGTVAILFLGALVTNKVTNPYAYGGVKKTFRFLEMQRVVGYNLSDNEGLLSFYYHINMGSDMKLADKVPEHLAVTFARKCELALGRNSSNALYDYLTKTTIQKGRSFWLKPIAKDLCSYAFSPFSIGYIFHKGTQNTGIANALFEFLKKDYILGKTYLFFAIQASLLLLIVSIPDLLNKKAKAIINLLPVLILTLYASLAVIRGFDYRNVLYIIVAWPLLRLLSEGVSSDKWDTDTDIELNIDSVLHGTGNF